MITPHPKEFSRLSGLDLEEILANPIELAREYASETGLVVLLKGATTVVTDGDIAVLVTAGERRIGRRPFGSDRRAARAGAGAFAGGVCRGIFLRKSR